MTFQISDSPGPHPLKVGLVAALVASAGGAPTVPLARRGDPATPCMPPTRPFYDALPPVDFGVEVEANGLDPERTALLVAPWVGPVQVVLPPPRWSFREADVPAKGQDVGAYRAVPDVSLAGARSVELVTPALSYRQVGPLWCSLTAMRAAGATVDSLAALHIHVNHTTLPAPAIVSLIRVFSEHEDLLFRLSGTSPRQSQHWCKPFPPAFLDRLRADPGLNKSTLLAHLAATTRRPLFVSAADAMRYHVLGLTYLDGGATLEFRQLAPTLDPAVLKARLDLVLALTLRAREGALGCLRRTSFSADRPEDVARFLDLIGIAEPHLTRSRQILLDDAAHPATFALAEGDVRRAVVNGGAALLGLSLAHLWHPSRHRPLRLASRVAHCVGLSGALSCGSLLLEAWGLGTYAWTHAAGEVTWWRLLTIGEPLRATFALALAKKASLGRWRRD